MDGSDNRAAARAPEDLTALLAALTWLDCPVPPTLERAIGYEGDARFVAFYFGGGDEAYHDDGAVSATGAWAPYLLFLRHAAVWPALVGYDFGSSDAPARHHLLLDRGPDGRGPRALYAGPARAVGALLRAQWPAGVGPNARLDPIALDEWVAVIAEEQRALAADRERLARLVEERMRAHAASYAELEAFLDAQPQGRAQELLRRHLCQIVRKIDGETVRSADDQEGD